MPSVSTSRIITARTSLCPLDHHATVIQRVRKGRVTFIETAHDEDGGKSLDVLPCAVTQDDISHSRIRAGLRGVHGAGWIRAGVHRIRRVVQAGGPNLARGYRRAVGVGECLLEGAGAARLRRRAVPCKPCVPAADRAAYVAGFVVNAVLLRDGERADVVLINRARQIRRPVFEAALDSVRPAGTVALTRVEYTAEKAAVAALRLVSAPQT